MTEPTAPLPASGPAIVDRPPRRRRRGWVIAVIVVAVLAILAIVGFFVADGLARDAARDYIRARIIEVFGLEPDARVDVELGPGSFLVQALAGRVDSVDVHVPEVTFGVLSGSAEVHAEGVPLDSALPVDTLQIEFGVDEADLAPIASSLSGFELEDIALEEREIVVATQFALFGLALPVGMGIEPSAADGQLVFTPTSVRLGDDEVSAEDMLDDPVFGSFARQFLQQQSVCVAEFLPSALTVTDADVEGERLVIRVSGDGAVLGGDGLSTPGTCAAG